MIDFMWQVLLNIVYKYTPELTVRMLSSSLWRNIKVMGHLQKNPISPTISYPDLGCRDPSGLPKLSLSRTSPNSPAWERRMDSLVIHGPRWWLNQAIWKLLVKLGIFPKLAVTMQNYLKPPEFFSCFLWTLAQAEVGNSICKLNENSLQGNVMYMMGCFKHTM